MCCFTLLLFFVFVFSKIIQVEINEQQQQQWQIYKNNYNFLIKQRSQSLQKYSMITENGLAIVL